MCRTPVETEAIDAAEADTDAAGVEMTADGGETAVVEDEDVAEDDSVALEAHATAAE